MICLRFGAAERKSDFHRFHSNSSPVNLRTAVTPCSFVTKKGTHKRLAENSVLCAASEKSPLADQVQAGVMLRYNKRMVG